MSRTVWRIGYAPGLSLQTLGYGSTLSAGRWHRDCAGPLQLVYSGSSRALCQLECRVHCNGSAPKNLALMRLELPDAARLLDVETSGGLPADWRSDMALTQQIGMRWLRSVSSVGLWVPSFVEPAEKNLLLNPAHADFAAITLVVEKNPFAFDPRLF